MKVKLSEFFSLFLILIRDFDILDLELRIKALTGYHFDWMDKYE